MKIIISGKGGQGIQFISLLIAKVAIYKEMYVTMRKSYGPEARGGFSQCSIVIDNKPISNPIIKEADYLLAFTEEAKNNWGSKAKNIIYHENMNNMEMLGYFVKITDGNLDDVIETMKHEISDKYKDKIDINIENLKKGYLRKL